MSGNTDALSSLRISATSSRGTGRITSLAEAATTAGPGY
jgi:hypothetical protein